MIRARFPRQPRRAPGAYTDWQAVQASWIEHPANGGAVALFGAIVGVVAIVVSHHG